MKINGTQKETKDFLPTALYNCQQIRELEQRAEREALLDSTLLMERAGASAFKVLRERWLYAKKIAVICGSGNNGGDGYVIARLAHLASLEVIVYSVGDPQSLKGAAQKAYLACQKVQVPIEPFTESTLLNQKVDVLVDALLGIGLTGEVKPKIKKVIEAINQNASPVFAIDVPSGLNADTGNIMGAAVKADVTITFIGVKQGFFTGSGPDYCAELYVDDLAIPPSLFPLIKTSVKRIMEENLTWLKPRPLNAHKGLFGHVLIVGGNEGMGGAVRMAGEAAARTGAGLVSVATTPAHSNFIWGGRPELMCYGIKRPADLKPLLAKASVIAIGPGLSQTKWGVDLLNKVMAQDVPLILDADALNLLAKKPKARDNWILTPHPGEAARLLKVKTEAINQDRFAQVRALQKKYQGVIVLKGAGSLIFDGSDMIYLCDKGNPGMASGGMGDILTGILAGLVAQGLALLEAAKLGVYLHGCAGDKAAAFCGMRGLLATDLFPYLQKLVNQP